jgi:putative glutamine amidotransferase
MNAKPVIGLTLDLEPPGGYATKPWYALRANYCRAVQAAGGVPVALPHIECEVATYLDLIDGLIVTGGAFDLDPSLYGAESRHTLVTTKDDRTRFELAMTRGALARDLPLLGICGGQQLLAVAVGGTLFQHIPDEVAQALAHEQPNPRDCWGHTVELVPGTLLHRLADSRHMKVNSAHHQAVKWVPDRVAVNARSPDGIIEGIEVPGRRFCLGVQWHPEYHVDPADERIFRGLTGAASERSAAGG